MRVKNVVYLLFIVRYSMPFLVFILSDFFSFIQYLLKTNSFRFWLKIYPLSDLKINLIYKLGFHLSAKN
jgi:hypothetical protein